LLAIHSSLPFLYDVVGLLSFACKFGMAENEDALLCRLQRSLGAVKQVCAQWFTIIAEMSPVLDSWSSLFEEYHCASLVDIETTPLSVHADIDYLTKSKTKRHLNRLLDELQIHQFVFRVFYF